jgi:murein DD-endopeptidase MepM/ murein hydrolase activator NlpD
MRISLNRICENRLEKSFVDILEGFAYIASPNLSGKKMPKEGNRRRRKKKHLYDIVVLSLGEGKKTFSFRASGAKLVLLGIMTFLVSVGITLAVLIYTPLAMYVPIPNPGLEEKYGRQIVETQEKLSALAERVVLLGDYNSQLRKALGEDASRDSAASKVPSPSVAIDEHEASAQASPPAANGAVETDLAPLGEEGEFESASSDYSVVSTSTPLVPTRFPLLIPTEGFVTQGFDPARRHYGIDLAARTGTPVHAAADGHVVFAGWTYDDGNMLIISHGGGYLTLYKHLQTLLKTGQATVKRGETIALLGSSGKTSLGPHLHFEVWKDGMPHDPNEYLLTPAKIQ